MSISVKAGFKSGNVIQGPKAMFCSSYIRIIIIIDNNYSYFLHHVSLKWTSGQISVFDNQTIFLWSLDSFSGNEYLIA